MQQVLSAENLSYIAQSTFASVRRFMFTQTNAEDHQCLVSFTRSIECRCMRGNVFDIQQSMAWGQLLYAELAALLVPPGTENTNNNNSNNNLSNSGTIVLPRLNNISPQHRDPNNQSLLGGLSSECSVLHLGGSSEQVPPDPLSNLCNITMGRDTLSMDEMSVTTASCAGVDELVGSVTPGQRHRMSPRENVSQGSWDLRPIPLNPKRFVPSESHILQAMEILRELYRKFPSEAASLYLESHLFTVLLEIVHSGCCRSRKVVDAAFSLLHDFLGEPIGIFLELAESFTYLVPSLPETITPLTMVPKLRTMLLLYVSLKRADLISVVSSNEVKSKFNQLGFMNSLLEVADTIKKVLESEGWPVSSPAVYERVSSGVLLPQNQSLLFTYGILCMVVLSGLVRSNVPNKADLRSNSLLFSLWSYYTTHVGKVECTFSFIPNYDVAQGPVLCVLNTVSPAVSINKGQQSPVTEGTTVFPMKSTISESAQTPISSMTPTTPLAALILKPPSMKRIKMEEQSVCCESVNIWASEMVEFLTEVCTTDSFSLLRQAQYAEIGIPSSSLNSTSVVGMNRLSGIGASSAATEPITATSPFTQIKWEPLQSNWDGMVATGSLFIWKMCSAATACMIDTTSASQMLDALTGTYLACHTSSYIFRCSLANILILCRASPLNMISFSEAGTARRLISCMVVPQSAFIFPDIPKPCASVQLNSPSWVISMSLLTMMIFTDAMPIDIKSLMDAIHRMTTSPLFAEDCEIIEHCWQVISSIKYPIPMTGPQRKILWFSSEQAKIHCLIDKFPGRWYGYSYAAWVNPLCIFSSGNHLFSYHDNSTHSAVIVYIVANGKSKCLALKSVSGSETLVSLLPDTSLNDGWNHICIIHNISGFMVFVNGRKRQVSSVTVPYPPTQRLVVAFGGTDVSHGVHPFFGTMTTPQLLDGPVPEKDVERLVAAGPGSVIHSIDPPIALSVLLEVGEGAISGLLMKIPAVVSADVPKTPNLLPSLTLDESSTPSGGFFGLNITGSSQNKAENLRLSRSQADLPAPLSTRGSGIAVVGRKVHNGAMFEDIFFYAPPCISAILSEERIVDWALHLLKIVSTSENRYSTTILIIEVLTAYCRVVKDGFAELDKRNIVNYLGGVLISWDSVPHLLGGVLLSMVLSGVTLMTLLPANISVKVLHLLVDLASQSALSPITRCGFIRELSSCLSNSENLKLFREGPGLEGLLVLSTTIEQECVDDYVILIEKVLKDISSMRLLMQYLVFQQEVESTISTSGKGSTLSDNFGTASLTTSVSGTSPDVTSKIVSNSNSTSEMNKIVIKIKVELLRMLYDVAKSNTKICDFIVEANGVFHLLYLSKNTKSEIMRVYALRLIALMLNLSRKLKEQFIQKNYFEYISLSLIPTDLISSYTSVTENSVDSFAVTTDLRVIPSTNSSIKIPTFNCLLKFALDSFHPSNEANDSIKSLLLRAEDTSKGKERSMNDPIYAMSGHLPGLVPAGKATSRRTISMDISSFHSGDNNDIEHRLNIDDCYHSQGNRNQTLVYAQLICTVMRLLPVVLYQAQPQGDKCKRQLANFGTHLTATQPSATIDLLVNSPPLSIRKEESLVLKVLSFLDRKILDLPRNASVLLSHPWMEWVWEGVSPVLVNRDQYSAATVQAVEEHARSIIRKIALADLLKSKNTSYVKRVKDYIDLSLMQQFVVEEVLRHFSTNNRLDLMNQEDATNVIRNLNTLLIGIEESIYPFPNHLVLEVVHALKVITVNTNSWVRSRIKNDTKLLVIRDKLAFSLLTDIYNILSDRPQYLDKIVEANMHDPNSSLVLLKSIVLAVEEKSCENIEALLGMLKTLIKLEPDHRIYMTKCFSDRGLCALFMSPTLSGDVLAQWCVENDAEWKAAAALIMSRCAKKIESDITMRAERRDKEIASKRKLRKAEIEKKHALQRKMVSDFDKVMQDISAQRKKYDEVMNRVAVKRSERDAERSRRDATGTAAEAQQPPMFVHEQPMSPLTDNLHDEIVSTIPTSGE